MLCAYLSLAVLAGLLGNTFFGAWWLDPLAGLFIAYVAVREGREAWKDAGANRRPRHRQSRLVSVTLLRPRTKR